ncbi:MAG: CRTAC1 family protein [Proteobacteria bacterium]|nr:CRTAC1 family protein [Pseudomonadota bacterium]
MRFTALAVLAVSFPAIASAAEAVNFEIVQPDVLAGTDALSSAWADYDNDGDLDLAVAFEYGIVKLFQNNDGVFADVSAKAGLGTVARADAEALKPIEVRSSAWGDYDGDGHLDLYVGTRFAGVGTPPTLNRSYLFHNNGDGTFAEVAAKMGVDAPAASVRQASFIDLDGDGDLDLFMADRNGANRMFRNDGAVFVDIAEKVGLADKRFTVGVCWFDMDKDGDLDAFVANQDGGTDAFYKNDKGMFTDVAARLGMDRPGRAKDEGGVGCSVSDYDNDGNLDIFVATYGDNLLYRGDGKGAFTEVAQKQGITGHGHNVGASWGDFDNDGFVDIFVADYHDDEPVNRLYRNTGNGFVDVITPVMNGSDHGVQWADYDGDGDLDLSLTNAFSKTVARHVLLRNGLDAAARAKSLQVMVRDSKGKYAPGAEVRLFNKAGKLLATRLVNTGDGYNSQSVSPIHFGLASSEPVTVEVTYITAKGRLTQRETGVQPGKIVTVKQKP